MADRKTVLGDVVEAGQHVAVKTHGSVAAVHPQPSTIQPVIIKVPASNAPLPSGALWIFAFLPLLLTMVGWFVVGRQADRRERRKDLRDSIAEIRKRIDGVEMRVADYVALEATDPKSSILAGQIKIDLQAIAQMINALKIAGLVFTRWDLLASLRQEATGGDFETSVRKIGDASRVALVSSSALELYVELDAIYFRAFPIKVA